MGEGRKGMGGGFVAVKGFDRTKMRWEEGTGFCYECAHGDSTIVSPFFWRRRGVSPCCDTANKKVLLLRTMAC